MLMNDFKKIEKQQKAHLFDQWDNSVNYWLIKHVVSADCQLIEHFVSIHWDD